VWSCCFNADHRSSVKVSGKSVTHNPAFEKHPTGGSLHRKGKNAALLWEKRPFMKKLLKNYESGKRPLTDEKISGKLCLALEKQEC